jgi:hypothetical protein
MTSIHRAVSFCPSCNAEQEVWFKYGNVVPNSAVCCFECEAVYESSQFIVKLLELRKNSTVSALVPYNK